MGFAGNVLLNAYSMMLLTIIFFQSLRHGERGSLQYKLFLVVLLSTIFLLGIDILSRFDGYPDSAFYPFINSAGNFMTFFFGPIIPSGWLLYVHFQLFHDEQRTLRWLIPLGALAFLNAAMTILTQYFGWYYTIAPGNIYHRGPLFWLPTVLYAGLLLYSYVMLIAHRQNIDRKYFRTFLFFAIPPSVCIVLQIVFYGTSLMLNSIALSILIVYFNIQNGSLYVDYLTGVNNRKRLELYLRERITESYEKSSFSAILIDLNDFKAINDSFGHLMGDDALETAAKLLKSCLRSDDFIARFGGDEFYVILETTRASDLQATVERINACVEKYNEHSGKPYRISFSMGFAVYDNGQRMGAEEFQKMIDSRMYENKRAYKNAFTSPAHTDSFP